VHSIPDHSGSARRTLFGYQLPFYGWAVVAVGTLITFCSGPGQSYVFSVFIDSLIEDTGFSRTNISALYAVGTGISAVMVMLVSRMADKYGARLMLGLVAFGLGLACFGMAVASGPIAFFLAFAALRALGQGSLPVNATLLAAQWFVRYRGRAMAIVGLGFAASNAVLPPLSRYLIDSIGWRGAYMVLGGIVWVLIIPSAILIVRNRPEDMGLHPDGADEAPEHERRAAEAGVVQKPAMVFTSLTFWLLAVPLSVPSFVSTALVFHQVSIFEERGLGAGIAAGVFVPFAIASAISGPIAGFLIDRIGPKNIFIANMGILLAGSLFILAVGDTLTAVTYASILGIAGGMQSVIGGVTWAHYYGRHGLGRVQGAAMMVMITSAAIGPLPLAALQQATGGYTLGLTLMASLPILAVVTILFARPTRAYS
jgi:MFS family permease